LSKYLHLNGVPELTDVPYLCHPVGTPVGGGTKAPQGPSNEELNRIPADPQLPPYGGSASLLMDLVAGSSMINDRASGIMSVRRKQT
jgi:hypothetical protein